MLIVCKNVILLVCITFLSIAEGSHHKREDRLKLELKDEKRYPNGTVIGKYTYKDKDGSPVHVKYYADDSSYGVELKSVKVYGIDNDPLADKSSNFTKTLMDTPSSLKEISTEINKLFTNATNNTFEVLNPYLNNYKKNEVKPNLEYELFLEKDMKPFGKNNMEKVRVYYDENKKKNWKLNKFKSFIY